MGWTQVKAFNPSKMGTRKGYCLMNCRLGFGIPSGTYPSAKADMEAQRRNGTLHTGAIPTNVAVPVYIDSTSKYEHVIVADHGVWLGRVLRRGESSEIYCRSNPHHRLFAS